LVKNKLFLICFLFISLSVGGCSNNKITHPDCADGVTHLSYYPNIEGISFNESFKPSDELIKIRIAYFEGYACTESDSEGYFIKQGGFKKVSELEFKDFIRGYNESCEGCLVEHFDGCC